MLVSVNFHPILIFAGKARSLLLKWSYVAWVSSSVAGEEERKRVRTVKLVLKLSLYGPML